MIVRNAESEDMNRMGSIMAVSLRTAFSDFVSAEILKNCAVEANCAAMLEELFQDEKIHFLIGEDTGMLIWQD